MNGPHLSCALVLAGAILSGAATQPPPPTAPAADAPRTDHAVGYYDPGLRASS